VSNQKLSCALANFAEMASTGEVASFGKDIHEAYWAALLSVNGFKLPRPHSGILLGGDINRPEMAVVAANLMRLGFHLYTHCKLTASWVESLLTIQPPKLPLTSTTSHTYRSKRSWYPSRISGS